MIEYCSVWDLILLYAYFALSNYTFLERWPYSTTRLPLVCTHMTHKDQRQVAAGTGRISEFCQVFLDQFHPKPPVTHNIFHCQCIVFFSRLPRKNSVLRRWGPRRKLSFCSRELANGIVRLTYCHKNSPTETAAQIYLRQSDALTYTQVVIVIYNRRSLSNNRHSLF